MEISYGMNEKYLALWAFSRSHLAESLDHLVIRDKICPFLIDGQMILNLKVRKAKESFFNAIFQSIAGN